MLTPLSHSVRRTAPALRSLGAATVFGGGRRILLAGFGGLLALMAVGGINAIRLSHRIQASSDEIRQEYLTRSRVLEQIRSDVYLSGTYVRDYLLEPERGKAEERRASLERTHAEMHAALAAYQAIAGANERQPVEVLRQELESYWKALEPVFSWNSEERQRRGYEFLYHEVFPRREAMLGIADRIAALNERQLDEGNRRVADIFSQFRGHLTIALALTLALGFVLAGFSLRKMLHLERETALRYAEIAEARAQLTDLSARLVEAQEQERRSLSRELHDEIGQSLSAALVELGNLSAALRRKGDTSLGAGVESTKRLLESCVGEVRDLALLLRPSMLDDFGLVPALQWQAREVSRRTGMHVQVAAEQVSDELPEEHKTCVYRIVQEALHNCSRHAQAHTVRVTVRQEANRLLVSVQDDGKGFQPARERGLGLLGMQERATRLGGAFSVESEPGQGARIFADLPLARAAAFQGQGNS